MRGILIEREAELLVISKALARACGGTPALATIEGTFGSGRSAVLSEATHLARGLGMLVCHASGSALERDFAFGVTRQLFEQALSELLDAEPDQVRRRAGELAIEAVTAPPSDAPGAHGVSYQVLHGLTWLVRRLAAYRPLLIAVDDLACVDTPSLRLLVHLVRRIDAVPVMVLLTVRSGDSFRRSSVVAELLNQDGWRKLPLAPLSQQGVASLLATRMGAPVEEFAFSCHAATGGNPLLTAELAEALVEMGMAPTREHASGVPLVGPPRVDLRARRWFAQISPDTTVIAEALALLDGVADYELLAQATGLSEPTVAATVEALRWAGLASRGYPLSLCHPTIRAALTRTLWSAVNVEPDPPVRPPEPRAGTWPAAAAVPAAAVRWPRRLLTAAAASAAAHDQPRAALALLRLAMTGRGRVQVLAQAGEIEQMVDPRAAVNRLQDALSEVDDPVSRARLSRTYATALTRLGRIDDAVAALERALDGLPGGGTGLRADLELLHLVTAHLGPVKAVVDEPPPQPSTSAHPADPRAEAAARAVRAFRAAALGHDAEAALRAASAALDTLTPDSGEENLVALSIMPLLWADDLGAVQRWEARLGESLRQGWRRRTDVQVLTARALLAHRRGQDVAASVLAATAVSQLSADARHTPLTGLLLSVYLEAAVGCGRAQEAVSVLARLRDTDIPQGWCWALVRSALARLRLARGDTSGAVAELLACGRGLVERGLLNPAISPWRSSAARLLHASGADAQAFQLVSEELELARRWARPSALGVALRGYANLHGGAAGLSALTESATVLARGPDQRELARSLMDLGSALWKVGRTEEARGRLRAAVTAAQQCRAEAVARAAQARLLATGARPRRAAQFGAHALTAGERRVAELAVRGMTNSEISRHLFVATRTVEAHLTRVYRKLGIRGRSELGTALAQPPA